MGEMEGIEVKVCPVCGSVGSGDLVLSRVITWHKPNEVPERWPVWAYYLVPDDPDEEPKIVKLADRGRFIVAITDPVFIVAWAYADEFEKILPEV
jgi:hypothetical protein